MKRSKPVRKLYSRKMFVENLENRTVMAGDCFHNFVLPEDADASGSVTPLDALVVINRINQSIASTASNPNSANAQGLVDVDADAAITPLDALVVIDHLNAQNLASGSPRASRVDLHRRIERIEQAIATNVLPMHLTIDDARATLDTLRSGGRPELGDHVISGSLRWKQDDDSSSDGSTSEPSEPAEIGSEMTHEQIELKRLERFIQSLSSRLQAFNVSPDVIATISKEMLAAQQAGTPLDLTQIRDRLAELGVDVDSILPQAARPGIPERPELPGRPERPEQPERPDRPEQPERPIMPAIMVTEPIAESILARLKNAGIEVELIETIGKEIWGAIEAAAPLDLQQVRARLEQLGIDWERLHAPPVNTLPVARPPMHGGMDVLKRVLPLLARMGIDRSVALTIYTEARRALAAGKPLSIEQIVARLKELGVSLDGIQLPTV
jgi:hypothetical protein